MVGKPITDAEVEKEIAELLQDDMVRLAKKEMRLQYKRRQYMYALRSMKRRGEALANDGVTMENIESLMFGQSENE